MSKEIVTPPAVPFFVFDVQSPMVYTEFIGAEEKADLSDDEKVEFFGKLSKAYGANLLMEQGILSPEFMAGLVEGIWSKGESLADVEWIFEDNIRTLYSHPSITTTVV